MPREQPGAKFRVENERIDAVVTLINGKSLPGHFFVAKASAHTTGPERIGELLNAETGLFPFELQDGTGSRTVLYNRRHVVLVELSDNEARRDPGYDVATRRAVSVLLSNGRRLRPAPLGRNAPHRPEGRPPAAAGPGGGSAGGRPVVGRTMNDGAVCGVHERAELSVGPVTRNSRRPDTRTIRLNRAPSRPSPCPVNVPVPGRAC